MKMTQAENQDNSAANFSTLCRVHLEDPNKQFKQDLWDRRWGFISPRRRFWSRIRKPVAFCTTQKHFNQAKRFIFSLRISPTIKSASLRKKAFRTWVRMKVFLEAVTNPQLTVGLKIGIDVLSGTTTKKNEPLILKYLLQCVSSPFSELSWRWVIVVEVRTKQIKQMNEFRRDFESTRLSDKLVETARLFHFNDRANNGRW